MLYQPSECAKRVWLLANKPQLAADDSDFREMLQRRGALLERRHLDSLGEYKMPQYPERDMYAGLMHTNQLVEASTPVIYQPVLASSEGFWGIPDFLILDERTGRYKVRDAKLAVDLESHTEIYLQAGLYRMAAQGVLGYAPLTEIAAGNGEVKLIEGASCESVRQAVAHIRALRELPEEPWEPVGYSKCEACVFRSTCWEEAVRQNHVASVPHVDQGASRKLVELGIETAERLFEMSEEFIGSLERLRGSRLSKIGATTARRIRLQLQAMLQKTPVVVSPIEFPQHVGSRPVVMFDIENDVFDPDLGVKVYLWGVLVAHESGQAVPSLSVAGTGIEGDKQGWFQFLDCAEEVFERFGDVPFVHYSAHEKTWVRKYIERYGTKNGVAERVLKNLWDMYGAIRDKLYLPVPSYGLKYVEGLAGFSRSQQQYGGLWSILMYDRYLNAEHSAEADSTLQEILVYNTEDLIASLKVYEWLESLHKEYYDCSKPADAHTD